MKFALTLVLFFVGCNGLPSSRLGKIVEVGTCSKSPGLLGSGPVYCRVKLDNNKNITLLGPVMVGDEVCLHGSTDDGYYKLCN